MRNRRPATSGVIRGRFRCKDEVTKRMGLKIAAPDPHAASHNQMKMGWFVLEAFPRLCRRSSWPSQKGLLGYYLPLAQYRHIPDTADIHPSVFERRAQSNSDYDPENLRNHPQE